ncbi:major capsid protein [Pantoea phage Kyle]|uniref:Major capsid protein n=1 Tax=Pantoea phage Kyle TaxID=2589665 RepID=A0A514A8M3_9CAUD|nr:major head protein [Pantoea phage Kyle]QDH49616.1 major capsid protein [Pantoea phage Kyle]
MQSKVHSHLSGKNVRPFEMTAVTDAAVSRLRDIGLVFDRATVQHQIGELNRAGAFDSISGRGMDASFTAPVTNPSLPTPIQFLQQWLPGFVKVMTAARKIDELVGITTVGSWEDQEIVQGMVEPAGTAAEYGDFTNIPLTSWNTNFDRRTIVRGELGILVGMLEEARSSAMRLNSAETKRQQSAVGLEVMRNAIGFFGWYNGKNRTFGFLNDPNLPAALTSTTTNGWRNGTFQQIINDVRIMVQELRVNSQDQINPQDLDLVLALPTNVVDFLSITTDFGISVRGWIEQTYPNLRIVSAPELMGAIEGEDGEYENVAYLYAESIDNSIDGSSDGGEVFMQMVQTKFMTLGVEKRAKSYVEDYANATAGVLLKRPWAVVRMIGI